MNHLNKMNILAVPCGRATQYHISAGPIAAGNTPEVLAELATFLAHANATLLSQTFFVPQESCAQTEQLLRKVFHQVDWPVTWVTGERSRQLAGMQAVAIAGLTVTRLQHNDRIVGSVFEDDYARRCYLGNLLPTDLHRPSPAQAHELFATIKQVLALAHMAFTDVIRTWFFLDDILSWYDDFNRTRDSFFAKQAVSRALLPASTGVGAGNPAGAALVANVVAVRPLTATHKICTVPSPLQCHPGDYRSSFSRALELITADRRELFISGTASLDQAGATMYAGDPAMQIERTMTVVGEILASRGMNWSNAIRAIAYFPRVQDAALLQNYWRHHAPITVTPCRLCRDDLLFELELDAAGPLAVAGDQP
ncbi:MAG: hypothetical protein A2521_05050 [Deltaproteobacteria bacterium RIFOXYD12_FULL_57_12]|nr:MAG: hypothetical protein A2521_05050 [Deltaproteobacteria bacterium RIFOXYD12_FULL_57_12]